MQRASRVLIGSGSPDREHKNGRMPAASVPTVTKSLRFTHTCADSGFFRLVAGVAKMIAKHFTEAWCWIRAARRNDALLILVCGLAALGLLKEGWEAVGTRWTEFKRPKMSLRGSFN